MIGKKEERARRAEFLPLEQHRNARHQQEISGHRAKPARARQRVTSLSGAGIGDLIVVLQKDNKTFRREIERGRAARFLLPLVALPLIEKAVFGGSDEFARATAVVRIVRLVMASQCHHSTVMEVVIPQRVEPVSAPLGWAHQLCVLRLVLSDNKSDSAAPCRAHPPDNGGHDMIVRSIENCLRRVEPQSVEMILVDPITRIGDEELAHRARIGTVEIDRFTPVVFVTVSEISRGEQFEIVSVRAEMVVDDVEDDGDPERMSAIDEKTEINRLAVEPAWGEEIDAIVSPTEPAWEFRHRQFQDRVIPSSARAGSSRAAAFQLPSGVKVPTCIS